ncbi:MAG TPA: universal stress protein [Methylomirabilota bacterium]|nr:universal stress protein [Methylomirabilota bacterium]
MKHVSSRHKPETKLPRLLFRNILVPVDGSENSDRAVRIATAVAKKYPARLFILHVVPMPVYLYTGEMGEQMPSPFIGEYMEVEEREAGRIVNGGVLLAKSHGVKATGKIVKYAPSVVEAIVSYAAERKVDLIVIGTRGLSGFKKLLLGSVTSGIVSHAHCEVLVVR